MAATASAVAAASPARAGVGRPRCWGARTAGAVLLDRLTGHELATDESDFTGPRHTINATMLEKAARKVVAENRRARFEYFIEEVFEAGIALQGTEVKSLRGGEGTTSG